VSIRLARALFAAILAAASVSACDDPFGKGCSVRACAAELTVVVHGLAGVEYTVAALAADEDLRTATCEIGASADTCSVFFAYFHPAEVAVRVSWADQEVTEQFAPVYETTYPNGPDCWPTCYEATVDVDVGQASQLSNTRLELTR
jgi:hypothetical protein